MANTLAKLVTKKFMKEHSKYLGYLKDRWDDERGYESWSGYRKVMKERFKSYDIVKILKVGVVLRVGESFVTIKAKKNVFDITTDSPA